MNWAMEGFTEAGLNTCDPGGWKAFLVETGGWEVVFEGPTPAATRAHWPGQAQTDVMETLLGRPGFETGRIRLFRFEQAPPEPIRKNCMPWDTGGIFDLDLRVTSLAPLHATMTDAGWTGVSAPIDWSFGELRILEWLAVGPDAVTLALIQRLHPPLDADFGARGFGQVFNSSQTVRNMDRAVAFYEQLGFRVAIRHHGPLAGRGGEVLGIDPDAAPDTPVDLVIMSPDGTVNGSVELVALPDRPGRDCASAALPHHPGLNLLRFPVQGIRAFARHLHSIGLLDKADIFETYLAPCGPVLQVNLQSPDGAWLEFYEHIT